MLSIYAEGFEVIGFSTQTQNSNEFNEKTAKIPHLWGEFYSSNLSGTGDILAVYSDYESDVHGLYRLTVGLKNYKKIKDYDSVTVLAGNYLVFQGRGPMPGTVIETWKQIWAYFANTKEHRRNFITDFEVYQGSEHVDIYIGIMN